MSSRLISVDELLEAPTGVDWDTVAENAGFSDARQAVEQARLIDRMSAWASSYCHQPLGLHATSQTEQAAIATTNTINSKAYVDRDGQLVFQCDTLPVLQLTSAQFSVTAQGSLSWNPVTVGTVASGINYFVEGRYPQQRRLVIFDQWYIWLKQQAPALVQVTYVSGWPNAALLTATTAGANVTLNVDSTTGMQAIPNLWTPVGNVLYVYDGSASEIVTVTAVVDTTHVTVANLANPHSTGVLVSGLPSDIKNAVIEACAATARVRGTEAFVMKGGEGGPPTQSQDEGIARAEYFLQPYRIEY